MTCHVLHTTHQQREKGLQFTHICTQGILQDVQRAGSARTQAPPPAAPAAGKLRAHASAPGYEATVLGWRRREARAGPRCVHRRLRRYTSPEAHHEPCFLSDPLQSTRGATAWGACLSHQTDVVFDAQGHFQRRI